MYQPMLSLHWKQIRFGLLPFILAAYGLPLIAVQGLGSAPGMDGPPLEAYRVLATYGVWAPMFPLLAAATGITLALSAWNWDHQLGHVYALSLPISRWRYAALKMGAGATLALIPAAAFWIGARVAVASISLPTGLHAYPNELAVRFLAGVLVCYALLFALAAGTVRTAVWVISGALALVLLATIFSSFILPHFGIVGRTQTLEWIVHVLGSAPGPFRVFTGNWTLIDV